MWRVEEAEDATHERRAARGRHLALRLTVLRRMLMHLLALPDIVDARIINLLSLADGPTIRAAGHRRVLLFADEFLIVCAIHSMMVQILRLVEATTLWIE